MELFSRVKKEKIFRIEGVKERKEGQNLGE